MLLDEASLFTPHMLAMLQTRLRTDRKEQIRTQAGYASNPGGPGHTYLNKRFRLKSVPTDEDDKYDPSEYCFVLSTVDDNPKIDPEYEKRLNRMPPDLRRAYRDGDWDSFVGQFFTMLNKKVHGFNVDQLPEEWKS